jgi:hypothetical protein
LAYVLLENERKSGQSFNQEECNTEESEKEVSNVSRINKITKEENWENVLNTGNHLKKNQENLFI